MTKTLEKQEIKASRLSKVKQTDGMLEEEPRTLAQFFGETIQGKYNTTKESEYLTYLGGLNKTDLQRHAIKCGLTPKDDRNRLIQSLVREFKRVVASYKPLPVLKNNKPISPEIAKILAVGR